MNRKILWITIDASCGKWRCNVVLQSEFNRSVVSSIVVELLEFS